VTAHIPDWPRMMKKATLARYLDMTPTEVEKEVSAGRLPMPIRMGSSDHWSRISVDSMIERMAGESLDDWRSAQPLYARS
jgi:hypothetical protein